MGIQCASRDFYLGEFMKKAVLMITLLFSGLCLGATYELVDTWTGDDNFSSAPMPACECDKDFNSLDCPYTFESEKMESDVCYDEYIPEGSEGWVHAHVFKKQ